MLQCCEEGKGRPEGKEGKSGHWAGDNVVEKGKGGQGLRRGKVGMEIL